MTRPTYAEADAETKAKLVEAWWSKKSKLEIREELAVSENYLETMWTRLRREGALPIARRQYAAKQKIAKYYFEEREELANEKRVAGSKEFLARLQQYHGCCGRFDIPPALLKTLRPAHGVKPRSQRDHGRAQSPRWDVRTGAPRIPVEQV